MNATDEQRADPVVLLLDDDEMARLLHRQALEPAGFEIVEAEHGRAALEAFAVTMPDIVVLDVVMPQMDGFAVSQAIRAMPAGRETPILIATGLDDSLAGRGAPSANRKSREEPAGCGDLDAFLTDLQIAQAATNGRDGATGAKGTLSRARLKNVGRTRGFQ